MRAVVVITAALLRTGTFALSGCDSSPQHRNTLTGPTSQNSGVLAQSVPTVIADASTPDAGDSAAIHALIG